MYTSEKEEQTKYKHSTKSTTNKKKMWMSLTTNILYGKFVEIWFSNDFYKERAKSSTRECSTFLNKWVVGGGGRWVEWTKSQNWRTFKNCENHVWKSNS